MSKEIKKNKKKQKESKFKINTHTTSLKVTKPVAVWNKPLKADFRKLFVALTKGVRHGLTGSWIDLAGDATEALLAVGLKSEPGELAYALIRNALTRAIFKLSTEIADDLYNQRKTAPVKFCKNLDFSFEQRELTIDGSFFDRPMDLPLLEDIKNPFEQWLIGHGLSEARAKTISGRLYSYFVYSLNKEWLRNSKHYVPIMKALETPFTKASKQEHAWMLYHAWLQKQVNENIFGETFSLNQIYVPLRAYYVKQKKKNATGIKDEELNRSSEKDNGKERIVIDLDKELIEWLKGEDTNDCIRVISGGPGCGKSSFSKMFATRLAQLTSLRVLYIPLYQFDYKDDLVESIDRFVQQSEFLVNNPLDPEKGERRLFIIFDGLDELSMMGKVGADTARRFVEEIDRTVRRRNTQALHLQVLISGRTLMIQATEDEFRKERQILHILPYYFSENDRKKYQDPKNLLKTDQRKIWWKKYGIATGRKPSAMPKELEGKELDELTAQPLLNYLLALSVARGKLDFSKNVNLNQIYRDLIEAVYERGYEASRPHRQISLMEKGNFIRILEEIGISTWHGDGRTTSIRNIQKHCETSGLLPLLEVFRTGAETGVTRLLTAFYFRRHGIRYNGQEIFEFTHKSFGEYLTALRIVRGINRIAKELECQDKDPDTGWKEKNCLEHWIELSGPTKMDIYLFEFIKREIQLIDSGSIERWQVILCRLIEYILKNGMPMEKILPRPSFHEETRQDRNVKESLLGLLNACARTTQKVSKINWPNPTSAGLLISQLRGQRIGPENVLAMRCLSLIDLSKCALDCQDFVYSFMHRVDFSMSDLRMVSFYGANLTNAIFENAILWDANFRFANLERANLERANLSEANLSGVNLRETLLSEANLSGANLRRANLERANLERANLERANLSEANLSGANLRRANLERANLSEANLSGANLRRANLERANLEVKTLSQADFYEANLRGVKISNIERFSLIKTLYKAQLDTNLKRQIKEKYPHLFVKPIVDIQD